MSTWLTSHIGIRSSATSVDVVMVSSPWCCVVTVVSTRNCLSTFCDMNSPGYGSVSHPDIIFVSRYHQSIACFKETSHRHNIQ